MRLAVLLLLAGAASGKEPMNLEDLRLLLQLKVPPSTIAELARTRCVQVPMTSSIANELVKLGATTELIGSLAEHQCRAPEKPAFVADPCPPLYKEDPAGKGCIDFRRGPAYTDMPPARTGRCIIDVTVDGVTDFLLRGTLMLYEVGAAGEPKDVNSSCTQPFPRREVRPSFSKETGRGVASMVAQPGPGNQFTLRIRVEDEKKGRDHYRMLIDWVNP